MFIVSYGSWQGVKRPPGFPSLSFIMSGPKGPFLIPIFLRATLRSFSASFWENMNLGIIAKEPSGEDLAFSPFWGPLLFWRNREALPWPGFLEPALSYGSGFVTR